MRVSSSTRILTAKEESDRIAREEAYASQIPGLTYINAAENNIKNKCHIDIILKDGNSGLRLQQGSKKIHHGDFEDHGLLVVTKLCHLSRTNPSQILEDNNALATSILDDQNLQQHRFGESTDESATEVDENDYGRETESGSETLTCKTRSRDSRKENYHMCNQNKDRDNTVQMRTHGGDKPFKCKKYNYATTWRTNFIVHERTHSDERPYKCRFCKYAATQRCHLIDHIRTHTGEKPFNCRFCQYSIAHSGDLINHIRIHTGEKPYMCHFCQYASSQSSSLNRHMKTHHKRALKLHAANSKKGKRIVLKKSGMKD